MKSKFFEELSFLFFFFFVHFMGNCNKFQDDFLVNQDYLFPQQAAANKYGLFL